MNPSEPVSLAPVDEAIPAERGQAPVVYFVSYAHSRGFGQCHVTRQGPIVSPDELNEMARAIEREFQKESAIVILSVQRFPL